MTAKRPPPPDWDNTLNGQKSCCFWSWLPWHKHRAPSIEFHRDENGVMWFDGKIESIDMETLLRLHEKHLKAMG